MKATVRRPRRARDLLRDAFNAGRSGETWDAFERRCEARARWDRYLARLLRCRPGVYPRDDPPAW